MTKTEEKMFAEQGKNNVKNVDITPKKSQNQTRFKTIKKLLCRSF